MLHTVSGMGFGMIAGVVAFANTLKESGGPGIVGVNDGGSQYFVLSAGELEITWSMLYIDPALDLNSTKMCSY